MCSLKEEGEKKGGGGKGKIGGVSGEDHDTVDTVDDRLGDSGFHGEIREQPIQRKIITRIRIIIIIEHSFFFPS